MQADDYNQRDHCMQNPVYNSRKMLSPQEWHQRFQQQAQWTQKLRDYLFQRAHLNDSDRILEVGCGTGAILQAIPTAKTAIHGLDLDFHRLLLAKQISSHTHLSCADAHYLPYETNSFDIIFSHYLYLWLSNPQEALQECLRVTRPGGAVIAIAEPDYGGRIDHPENLQKLGALQTQALAQQGADPLFGRRLKGLFVQAGLQNIETGVLSGQWQGPANKANWQIEWRVLADDLKTTLSPQQLETYQHLDWQAWQQGDRIMFIPTFYSIGFVP